MRTFGRLLLALVFVGGAGVIAYIFEHNTAQPAQAEVQQPAVPVVTGTATLQDFPIYQAGIGTVQAYNQVTIRARVDGTLQQVLFTEGQDVKAGTVLGRIDPRPFQAALDQAVAAKAKDEAQLANSLRDLKRFVDLRDFATKQSVDTQNTLVDQLKAMIAGDQAAIENATTELSYTTITSPIDGRTGARLVDAGNLIRASEGTPLLVVTQVEPIFVTFTLPQDALDEVLKARAPVSVEVYKRDDSTRLATGTLTLVDNRIDTATGTILFKATFANSDRRLWPGEFVNVRVITEIRRQAVVVPSQAVQRGPDELFVYVVKPDQTVELRPVTSGPTVAGLTLVETGLSSAETVVLDGQYKLKPGMKVRPVTPG
jgi:membrane fusion protein, multidrug efflux system